MNAIAQLIHLFIPYECVSCGRVFSLLCDNCVTKIKLFSPHCVYCQKTSSQGRIHTHCKMNDYCADFSFILFHYSNVIKKIFYTFKYEEAYSYGDIIKELLKSYSEVDPFLLWKHINSFKRISIIPVPMHWTKQMRRGFSPAKMIGEWLKQILKSEVHIAEKIVVKTRPTKKQAGLSKRERLKNQSNVFVTESKKLIEHVQAFNPDILLIVDDVLSSGATVNSVVEVIKKSMETHNIKIQVGIFAIARG